MRILVVEDEPTLCAQLVHAIAAAGHTVESASDGITAHYLGDVEDFDAVVLDLGLPTLDGLSVLRRWRAAGRTMPVLILTARSAWHEKVAGMDAGADDYLAKPFSPRELAARARALLRRAAAPPTSPFSPFSPCQSTPRSAPFHDDPQGQRVQLHGHALALTRREYRLLSCLLAGAGRIHSRAALLTAAWGDDSESTDRTVDTHIKTLRAKLREVDAGREYISTHRGMGYCLDV